MTEDELLSSSIEDLDRRWKRVYGRGQCYKRLSIRLKGSKSHTTQIVKPVKATDTSIKLSADNVVAQDL
jgi:hypothetical protein